jgi:Type IV secretory pathway, VirB11 components, and related ATPases involved in archaeal flagella biosynthesis
MYVDSYGVLDGLVRISILLSGSGEYVYWVDEPKLSDSEEELIARIRSELNKSLSLRSIPSIDNYSDVKKYVRENAESLLRRYIQDTDSESLNKVMYYILRDTVGFGPLEPLINDPRVEDVHVNGPGRSVFVWHNKYGHIKPT